MTDAFRMVRDETPREDYIDSTLGDPSSVPVEQQPVGEIDWGIGADVRMYVDQAGDFVIVHDPDGVGAEMVAGLFGPLPDDVKIRRVC